MKLKNIEILFKLYYAKGKSKRKKNNNNNKNHNNNNSKNKNKKSKQFLKNINYNNDDDKYKNRFDETTKTKKINKKKTMFFFHTKELINY